MSRDPHWNSLLIHANPYKAYTLCDSYVVGYRRVRYVFQYSFILKYLNPHTSYMFED